MVVYSSQPQQFIWEGFGLKLYIQEGSLPRGMEKCTIDIKASLAGQYRFPEEYQLVSAVFWFRCEAVRRFAKAITVEIQHCAKDPDNLSFVRTSCSQKQLSFTFKHQGGGRFNSCSSYGIIELNSFSGEAIVQPQTDERNYLTRLLSKELKGRSPVIVHIFFVVTWNTDAHHTVS